MVNVFQDKTIYDLRRFYALLRMTREIRMVGVIHLMLLIYNFYEIELLYNFLFPTP